MGKEFEWIIVGGGAAGLFAGANLPAGNHLILESGKRVGLKVLMSGGGMCNFTHDGPIYQFESHYGTHKSFVKGTLKRFDNGQVRAYFEKHGVSTFVDERGKVFPTCKQANALVQVMTNACRQRGVSILTDHRVVSIAKGEHGFTVKTEHDTYSCKKVLLATGGKSYPTTGSDGNGYALAKQLGHTIVTPRVGLSPIKANQFTLLPLAGTAFSKIMITLERTGCKGITYTGELLITHEGLSGPVILDNSRDMRPGDTIKLNVTKSFEKREALESVFIEKSKNQGTLLVKTVIREVAYSKRIADHILKMAEINENLTLADLNKNQRKHIVGLLIAYPVEIKCLGGFEIAMSTVGGVSLDEIDPKTMMSKRVDQLYFAGEVMDVDGDSGGYNIQWAFSSAAVAISHV